MKMKRQVASLVISALLIGLLPMGNATVSKAGQDPTSASAITTSAAEETAGAGYGLNNPTKDSDEVTTWDCVWFGNYWQEDTNGDGKTDKKDKKQPIKWRVLSVEGDDAFLLADKNLDCQRYNYDLTDVTWETCTIRSWLNGYGAESNQDSRDYSRNNFLDYAFTSVEQSAILTTNVVNDDNPEYGTEGGNDTFDRVYLLSFDEVINPVFGFPSDYSKYAESRRANSTEYAKAQGVWTSPSDKYVGNSVWWLRSPGRSNGSAADVDIDGYVFQYGTSVHNTSVTRVAVRPALHLNLSSVSSWSYAGKVIAEEIETVAPLPTSPSTSYGLNNPAIGDDGVTTWDCVWFGNYWQENTNGNIIDEKQPIKWRVLSVDGDDVFLLADKNLDCQEYNFPSKSATWETCDIRSWLNGYGAASNNSGLDYGSNNFLKNAFSESEQSAIRNTNVVNNSNSYFGTEGGNDTLDKVYLLSLEEVVNPAYGFSSEYKKYAESRRVKNTEYVKNQGAYTSTGNGNWWLRSPGGSSTYAACVYYHGNVSQNGSPVGDRDKAVRPALHLNLSSVSSWSYAGKITSEGEEIGATTPTPKPTSVPSVNPIESPGIESSPFPTSSSTGYTLNNPTTDSNGVTTWDCVWFGNYWQEDTNGDGKADKDDEKQPIKWRVLSVDGDDAFLLADKNLDCQEYNDNDIRADVTWETCTIRSWLNGYGAASNKEGKDYSNDNFFDYAFTPAQQSAIRATNVMNDNNPEYGIEGGNNTSDQVYLLSVNEAMNPVYGFSSSYNAHESRRAKNTEYTKAQGAYTSSFTEYASNGNWWLRSPGAISYCASNVYEYGDVNQGGSEVNYFDYAVRPVLHLNLSSVSNWSYAGKVTSEGKEIGATTPTPEPTSVPSVNPIESPGMESSPLPTAPLMEYNLNNPATGSDGVMTWDCVWFGSYWQEDTNGDGKADKNDEKQPIKWRVLSVNGDDAFLLADKNLDCQRYNDTLTDVTWETCTMRSWLNGYGTESNQEGKDYSNDNFLDYAFTSAEQSAICTTNVVNNDNLACGTEGGNGTSDKVYLLSLEEVLNPVYGFSSAYSIYDESRRVKNTEYAKAKGAWTSPSDEYAGNGSWWLRSPGDYSFYAAYVNHYGYASMGGLDVQDNFEATRPALHLNLSSASSWSYAGKVTSEGKEIGAATPEPTSVPSTEYGLNNPATGSDGVTTWDCVWFGSYWQEDTNGDGKDDKNDEKQPIKWRVLSVNGDDAFLLADKNLDCQKYNDTYTSVTWETCTMRSWLNGYGTAFNKEGKDYSGNNFLNNAFSADEQSAIQTTNIVNKDNSYYGTEGGNDTSDKVYLLSLKEVMNPVYGFSSDYSKYDESRRAKNTEYTKAQGAYTYTSTYKEYAGNGYWWLRSPGYRHSDASDVNYDGYVYRDGIYVHDNYRAVRPALHLNLSSDSSWSYAGKVTSKGEVEEEAPSAPGATEEPDQNPTASPGTEHSPNPTSPLVTSAPTEKPGVTPTANPTEKPTESPGMEHSPNPTIPSATSAPTEEPEATPIVQPTSKPTESPGMEHSSLPTAPSATSVPTEKPEVTPTLQPTDSPSVSAAATTEPGGESTMKPMATVTVPSTAKPTTTPEAVTPFVPVSPSQTFTSVLQLTASPTVTSVGKVASIKLTQKKRTVTASWKKVPGTDGYQIWYSTSKKWKGKKQKLLRKNKVKVKKLKKKKTYYFRVRAYRLDGTKKVYGAWSKTKKIKMKK